MTLVSLMLVYNFIFPYKIMYDMFLILMASLSGKIKVSCWKIMSVEINDECELELDDLNIETIKLDKDLFILFQFLFNNLVFHSFILPCFVSCFFSLFVLFCFIHLLFEV